MSSIHLVLYFTQESPLIFEIQDSLENSESRLTIPELKSQIHDFIEEFRQDPKYQDYCQYLIDQEFTGYQGNEERTLIARCDLQAKHKIEKSEQEMICELFKELKKRYPSFQINPIQTEKESKQELKVDSPRQNRDGRHPFGGLR